MLESWLIAWWVLFLALSWYPCPDCCGIECDNCVNGDTNSYMTLVIDGVANASCSNCVDMNGTWVLTYLGDTTCWWSANTDVYCNSQAMGLGLKAIGTVEGDPIWETTASFSPDAYAQWYGAEQSPLVDCLNADGSGAHKLTDVYEDPTFWPCDASGSTIEVYSGDTT